MVTKITALLIETRPEYDLEEMVRTARSVARIVDMKIAFLFSEILVQVSGDDEIPEVIKRWEKARNRAEGRL